MNCDTGRVFYMFPLKFLSICMLNVTVTFLSTLQFFLGNWNAFMLYSLQGYSCKLKKKKKPKTFLPMESFQNTYRRYTTYIVGIVLMSPELCAFTPVWCQSNAGHLPLRQLTGIKGPLRGGPLGGLSFPEFLCMATQAYSLNFFLQFIIFSSYCSCAFKLESEYFYI